MIFPLIGTMHSGTDHRDLRATSGLGSHLICWDASMKWLVSTPAFTAMGVCISTRSDTPLGREPLQGSALGRAG
jgi:hypothetical protein